MKPRDEDQVSDQWLGFAAHQMEGGFGAHDEG
jgi:hypothetical protein